jgi:hypothetical protein
MVSLHEAGFHCLLHLLHMIVMYVVPYSPPLLISLLF